MKELNENEIIEEVKEEVEEDNQQLKTVVNKSPVSTPFENTIKKYLDEYASQDELFAEKYKDPNKSISECCGFICDEVNKMAVKGISDEEVYYLARHYYEESDLKAKPFSGNVVVNHAIELTEEEKEKAHLEAIAEYKQKKIDALKAEEQKEKERQEKTAQKEKEKQEKAAEKQKEKEKATGQQSLFDFLE